MEVDMPIKSYIKANYVEKKKIEEIIKRLDKEETLCQKAFDELWEKDNLTDVEKIKKSFYVDMQQEIGAIRGMLEELLEE